MTQEAADVIEGAWHANSDEKFNHEMRWLLRMVSLTCSVTYFAPLVLALMNWM